MDLNTVHPLPKEIRARVLQELDAIEREHDVKVLFACESGSRAWGFASTNSDFDVRFVYVPRIDWHIDLDRQRPVIDRQIPELDLDMSGWSLGKTLGLMRKSNPALLEWLGSPLIYCYTLREELGELRDLALSRFKPEAALGHYTAMIHNTHRRFIADEEEVIYKKYFYCLRPIFAVEWTRKHGTMPPTEYYKLVEDYNPPPALRHALDELMFLKRGGEETRTGPHLVELDNFIESKLAEYGKMEVPETDKPDDAPLNDFFRRMVRKYDFKFD
ncbi:nucleotidyltransferase [Pseudomonas phage D6]|nr:nucleotidyltransferase [Pseudomonas phage D6]